ncbi:hypothetical protein DVH24_021282, partial [Malus domestica]
CAKSDDLAEINHYCFTRYGNLIQQGISRYGVFTIQRLVCAANHYTTMMATSKQLRYNCITFWYDVASDDKDTSTMDRIWESSLQIYAYVGKLRKAPRFREQTKLTNLERWVKALEDIVSNFEEPQVEAMLV